jgi:Peptidase family M48
MKSIQIFGLIAFFTLNLFTLQAQKPLKVRNSCNYYGKETEQDYYQFEPSNEAQQIVNELLASSGLSASSFVLKESNCSNALATTVDGVRFILYNPDFLRKFKQDAATKWAAYGALAHEIGHHLNGHNLSETNPAVRRQYELEADKFAGNLLFHLHATVDEAQAGIKTIPLEGQTATHPSKTARLVATTNGWTAAYDLSRKNGDGEVKMPDKPVSTPTFTEVSDRLLENRLLGKWTCEGGSMSFLIGGKGTEQAVEDTKESFFTWSVKSGNIITNQRGETDSNVVKFLDNNTIEIGERENKLTFNRVK